MPQTKRTSSPHLLWVYPVPVATALDSATWLQTTQELRKLGWQVTLVGEGPAGQQVVNGVQVNCIPTVRKYFLGPLVFHARLLLFLLQRWSTIQVVLFHQLSAPWVLPLKLLRLLTGGRYPLFVMDTRDLNVVEGTLKNRMRIAFFDLMHTLANWFADGQTAITPRMVDLVKIPKARQWGVWPSGVSLERFADVHIGRRWPTNDEPIQLMYVGKLHSERNLLPLAQAVENVNTHGRQFVLTFVGSGPEQAKLEEFAAQTAGRVRVCPPVSHEQIPDLLRETHIGVTSLPAPDNRKFQASSPIKLFEYMASGLPLFSTSNVCHTDVIGDGQYAFWAYGADVASLEQALENVWQARSNLPHLGESARQAVNAWTWQAAGQQLDQALKYGLANVANA